MPYLIDGHNLIGRSGKDALGDPDDERKLLEALVRAAARTRRKMIVFFDRGSSAAGASTVRLGPVEARFIRPPKTADDAILDFLHGKKDARNYTVISSDRGVRERSQRAGAKILSAEQFNHSMQAASEKRLKENPPDKPEEIEDWLQLFNR